MKLGFALAAFLLCTPMVAQVQTPPSAAEIADVLGIHTWRVRKPLQVHRIWDIKMIDSSEVKPPGEPGSSLSRQGYLLALRDLGRSSGGTKVAFTLPQEGTSYSSGEFDLAGDLKSSGQVNIEYFPRPRYSRDGSQCLIGKVTSAEDGTFRYIALVLASNRPQADPIR